MKNIKKTILIIITCLLLCLASTLKADSGWDGDYDYNYGGSDWDFDFDFDLDNSSNTRYPGKHTSSEDLGGALLAFVLFVVLGIGLSAYALSASAKSKNNNINTFNNITDFDINKIKEILPDFNLNEFRSTTFEAYKNIQESWMNFNYDELKKHTTNELFNLYKSELMALKVKKQKNIMSDFNLEEFSIKNMEKGTDDISVKIHMTVSCLDYVVNKNDEVVRGTNKRKVVYKYEMTFTKGLNRKDNKCPNCNAPLENVTTSTCPYCNSTVISTNHDWVLSKKQVINQRLK